jgi:hypothetical protein
LRIAAFAGDRPEVEQLSACWEKYVIVSAGEADSRARFSEVIRGVRDSGTVDARR